MAKSIIKFDGFKDGDGTMHQDGTLSKGGVIQCSHDGYKPGSVGGGKKGK